MAFPQQNVTVGLTADRDGVTIKIGPYGFTLPVQELKDLYTGRSRNPYHLLWEFAKVLATAGIDPATATPAQIKQTIEAQTYPW